MLKKIKYQIGHISKRKDWKRRKYHFSAIVLNYIVMFKTTQKCNFLREKKMNNERKLLRYKRKWIMREKKINIRGGTKWRQQPLKQFDILHKTALYLCKKTSYLFFIKECLTLAK
jgi:hypothetical protein